MGVFFVFSKVVQVWFIHMYTCSGFSKDKDKNV
jgi:hypothetical protein